MNNTYRKNLKDLGVALKNYTDSKYEQAVIYCDESINNLLWQLGTYDLGVDTDNSVARVKTLHANTIKSMVDYIGGKTIKYNQLAQTTSFSFDTQDNTKEITDSITFTSGHKYLFTLYQSATLTSALRNLPIMNSGSLNNYGTSSGTLNLEAAYNANLESGFKYAFFNCSTSVTGTLIYWSNTPNVAFDITNIIIVDLTQKFGAGNEPSTVETAIPLLKANGYKLDGTDTYSTGSLKHAITTSINFLPINIWDEEWELGAINNNGQLVDSTTQIRSKNYIEVLPSTSYYFCNKDNTYTIYAFEYDTNHNFIGTLNGINTTATTSSNCAYLKFYVNGHTTYNHDICVNISNASYNGNYYPYIAPITKAIPNEVLADTRYGLGFDNSNYNHLDSDGHLRGSWGIVDLGTLNYSYGGDNPRFTTSELTDFKRPSTTSVIANAICSIYTIDSTYNGNVGANNMALSLGSNGVLYIVNNNYTDATAFKTAMSGVYLVYELNNSFDQDYSQYFTPNWNKVNLDKQYATCEMVCDEPIDMPNSITNLFEEVKA